MNSKGKLFLLDGMALIYRSFFALNKNPRITSKGLNTSAMLGFVNTLIDVLKTEQPTHIGVAFDTAAPTQRHEDFAAYKANRQAMPEDLAASIPYIIKIIEAFNIPILVVEGYEADDIIGTLAKKAEQEGFVTYMMTPDKDFGQLVTDKILIYKPAKFGNPPEIWGPKEVCERFGLQHPEQVKDLLGLWGDASDNIPGIPGFGEVTARKLLSEFHSLENLIEQADKIGNPRWKEKVKEFAQQAIFSKQLATILLDVPIEFNAGLLKRKPPLVNELKQIFDELEFRTLSQRIFNDKALIQPDVAESSPQIVQTDLFGETSQGKNMQNTPHEYHLVQSKEEVQALAVRLSSCSFICFDTETTGLDPHNCELVGISFSVKPGEAWFISLPENYHQCCELLYFIKPLLENSDIEKIGQNIKFDISVLQWYDIQVKGKLFDTMIAHYLLQPDLRHNMDFMARTYLDYSPVSIETLIGKKGKQQGNMRDVPLDKLKDYACEDADITLQLSQVFRPLLSENNLKKLAEEIENPLIPVLASMEAEGVSIDIKGLQEYSIQLKTEIKTLENQIYEDAGVTFNISSPKQLGEILFDRLQLAEKAKKTSKSQQYATSEDILLRLSGKHPIVQKILDYRSLTKLKSTYVDALPELLNPRTGRIHTTYNQAVAATGRLSSNNPNLQNIPIRTERGREIRKAFIPRNKDYVLLSADYSQIELRLMAEISGDIAMKEAFMENQDIHSATAARIYGVDITGVTAEMRRNAKTVNFGIIYGMSAFGLSDRLNIPRQEAAEIIRQYFLKYPGIEAYMKKTIAFAKANGYVETLLGRRRYIRDINSSNANIRQFAERNAINAPIQGSAADMIKIAMINIHNDIITHQLKSRMIMQVHDELVFDVWKSELEQLKSIVKERMTHALPLSIPVVVEMDAGQNWLEAH